MSAPIWTPDALSSEAHPYRDECWRLVEAQHWVSTLRLADSLEEQAILEDMIEVTKPTVPEECRHLDYLLSTPFRYNAVYPTGSRFRRGGKTPGVFYGSERPHTAVAEIAFYRLLFYIESPQTPRPASAADYTAFSVSLTVERSIDLTKAPFHAEAKYWLDPSDYGSCQTMAGVARSAQILAIKYQSVRDPNHGCNLAVLSCTAFCKPHSIQRQTWRIRLGENSVQAICEHPRQRIEFPYQVFANDSRIVGWLKKHHI